MKKIICFILLQIMICNMALADCDWTTIKPMPNGDYEYNPELHLCVGKLVQSDKTKDAQVEDLTKAIQLKDLALTKADERTDLWKQTAYNEQDRLNKIESGQRTNDWIFYGLGALTVIASGFMAAKLIHN